ncbi:MAG: glycerophosphodiester phosphodiesterase [Thermomicrobiales bacterium]|nr:glycerophosphodiester phosphodiesterase [Thermomicrobiales bacterium]MCO5220352.1 glycerophosphodiester phosphodiesterase [Thermomicrobiales bacterium]
MPKTGETLTDRRIIKRTTIRIARLALAMSLAMAMTIGKDFSLEARQAVFGQRQIQFYVPYSGSTPVYLPPVLLVAHNAGNQESTARRALGHQSAGMEIDIRYEGGVLYATHSAPSSLVPTRAWQVPRLGEAFGYTAGATVLKLDLKSTGQSALDSLVRFVDGRPTDQQIIFVSKHQDALIYLGSELDDTLAFLSVGSAAEVDALLEQDGRLDGVDGLSIPEWTLTPERVIQLKERGYLIDAWTVNDVERLVELAALGVDVITTDNLAFFDMASGPAES